jgi:hypothetical protein
MVLLIGFFSSSLRGLCVLGGETLPSSDWFADVDEREAV